MHQTPADLLESLQDRARKLRGLQGAAGVVLIPLLFVVAASDTPWAGAASGFTAAYVAVKVRRYLKDTRRHRQLRLERQFAAQRLSTLQIRQCLRGGSHLWSRSLILSGLRGVQKRPLPRLLAAQDKADRLKVYFQEALTALRRPPLAPEGLLLISALPPALVAAGPSWTSILAVVMIAGAGLSAERAAFLQERHLHDELDRLAISLGRWTLDARLHIVLFDRRKLYAHTLLYAARPLFRDTQQRNERIPLH